MKGLLATVLAVFAACAAMAQESAVDDVAVETISVCARWNPQAGAWEMTSANELGECGVIGSRRIDRVASDSPVPVDVIQGTELLPAGSSLDSLLAFAAPSFNVSQGADAAMFIQPATLRGLAPDAALVLTNGKRRHRGAIIALLGYGIGGGGQGVDLAAIPTIAVERVEVLRDSASAQYGSDAIAGIVNIVLRKANKGANLDFKWGTHHEGDGDAYTLAGNIGLPFGGGGGSHKCQFRG